MEKEDEINWKIAHTSAQDMHLGEVNLAYRLGWGNWSSLTAWAAHISTLYLRTTTVISGRLDGGLYYVSQQMDWRHAVNERKIERAHALRSLRTLSGHFFSPTKNYDSIELWYVVMATIFHYPTYYYYYLPTSRVLILLALTDSVISRERPAEIRR